MTPNKWATLMWTCCGTNVIIAITAQFISFGFEIIIIQLALLAVNLVAGIKCTRS